MKKLLIIAIIFFSCTKESTTNKQVQPFLGIYDKGNGEITTVSQNGNYLKIEWDWHDNRNKNNITLDSVVLNSDNSFVVNEYAKNKYILVDISFPHFVGGGMFSENAISYKIINTSSEIIFTGVKRR